ncbi:signal transduction histidine kinase [Kitasatospora gansuensis]|uniref:histidine kinase n=1 Tax=Kitasatospora gansuensis TaxID=258050 RepID=A0A7W7SHV8_9ACTN|nr:sensor histidine kinase [Kitasatospora gansuensis]MBB4949601.1 signal transduction histidine kinase [Kitasatospora gansuensis]
MKPQLPSPVLDRLQQAGDQLADLGRALLTPVEGRSALMSTSRRAWVRWLPYLLAFSAVATLLPVGTVVLAGHYELPGGVAGGLALVQSGPLLLAVTRPLQAWWVMAAGVVAGAALTAGSPATAGAWPWPITTVLCYVFLMPALALRERGRTLLAVWLVTLAASIVASDLHQDRAGETAAVTVAISGAVLLLGWSVRGRGEAQRLLAEQEQISEAERERSTLLEERARIARELHDVVAHHMSVITVQADSAPYRIGGLPPEAVEEFGTIATAARSSLTEMRRLLGVLRSDGAEPDRLPQPGLAQLGRLVETVGQAGVRAELTVAPEVAELGELPQAVSLSAYRIVQEALANVVRHAPGARAEVRLTAVGGTLRVTVENSPGGRPGVEGGEGTGHGLVGMRERVRLLSGRLETGGTPAGGFLVAAELPVELPVNPLGETPR